MRRSVHELLALAEELGFDVSIEFDAIKIECPPRGPMVDFAAVLAHYGEELRQTIKERECREARRIRGGPLDGRSIHEFVFGREFDAVSCGRGHWAVYRWESPTWHFVGYASSRKKAREGKLKSASD